MKKLMFNDKRQFFLEGVIYVVCMSLILSRGILEGIFTLPAPYGDSILFLATASNLCRDGFFGTSLFPIDPLGQNRFIWHGFLSPWLYGSISGGCEIRGFYLMSLGLKTLTLWVVWRICRIKKTPLWCFASFALLTWASQSVVGFRPEALAIFLIVSTELSFQTKRGYLATLLISALAWTQPTVFGLYMLFNIFTRPAELVTLFKINYISAGILAMAVFAFIYPFPIIDLIKGISLQASMISSRSHEDGFINYYLLAHFLPGWALVFVFSLFFIIREKMWLVITLPFLWWFGPRVPATNYNLIALLPLCLVMALRLKNDRIRIPLAILAFGVGTVGLSQQSLRDGLTLLQRGSGIEESRRMLEADLNNKSVEIVNADGLVHILVNPKKIARSSKKESPIKVSYRQMSGLSQSPCPEQQSTFPGLMLHKKSIFNTPSGWQFYRCVAEF